MCGDRKKPKMLDRKLRGTHDLEVTICELRKRIDQLEEELQAKEIQLKLLEDKINKK